MSDASPFTPERGAAGRPDRARLFDVASEQAGYFTADQARNCGYSWALLSHHVNSGRFIRVRRGLYRLSEYPSSSREDVLAAWLAAGKDVAVVSHDSALDLLGLSDAIPNAVHLTVPRSRRSLHSMPGVTIHTTSQPLLPDDHTIRQGTCLTSAARSIADAAEAGTAPDQIELAVAQAIERGLTTAEQLQQHASRHSRRVAALIGSALRKAER